jgi:hypothetical protein
MRSYCQSVMALGMLLYGLAITVVGSSLIHREWAPVIPSSFAETESVLMKCDGPSCKGVSIEDQTFVAFCNFKGYGTVSFREDIDLTPCTTCSALFIRPRRFLKITSDIGGLCPNSEYTLSLHRYNCVTCNCKNAGPLLGLSHGIIRTDLLTTKDNGNLNVNEFKNDNFSIVPTDKSKSSILGGSCVLTQNCKTKKKAKSSKKSRCQPCPSILCAPITVQPAFQQNHYFPPKPAAAPIRI